MVLEKIISVRESVKNPLYAMAASSIITLISMVVAFIVFPEQVGLFSTLFITIALAPFTVNLFSYEEAKEEELIARKKEQNLLKRNWEAISVLASLFIGMVLIMTTMFMVLPEKIVYKIFQEQLEELRKIRGSFATLDVFEKIFLNNVSVALLAYLFSFLFGAGAIFIFALNASVLSAAIGLTAKSLGGIYHLPVAIAIFLPHGILEFLAYFIAGLAGGLISAALTRKKSEFFYIILRDSLKLLVISIIILFFAAWVEILNLGLLQ